MLSFLATYDALSLVITKPSFIWFGSRSVDICTALVNSWYKRGRLHFLCIWTIWKSINAIEVLKLAPKRKILAKEYFKKSLSTEEVQTVAVGWNTHEFQYQMFLRTDTTESCSCDDDIILCPMHSASAVVLQKDFYWYFLDLDSLNSFVICDM